MQAVAAGVAALTQGCVAPKSLSQSADRVPQSPHQMYKRWVSVVGLQVARDLRTNMEDLMDVHMEQVHQAKAQADRRRREVCTVCCMWSSPWVPDAKVVSLPLPLPVPAPVPAPVSLLCRTKLPPLARPHLSRHDRTQHAGRKKRKNAELLQSASAKRYVAVPIPSSPYPPHHGCMPAVTECLMAQEELRRKREDERRRQEEAARAAQAAEERLRRVHDEEERRRREAALARQRYEEKQRREEAERKLREEEAARKAEEEAARLAEEAKLAGEFDFDAEDAKVLARVRLVMQRAGNGLPLLTARVCAHAFRLADWASVGRGLTATLMDPVPLVMRMPLAPSGYARRSWVRCLGCRRRLQCTHGLDPQLLARRCCRMATHPAISSKVPSATGTNLTQAATPTRK